MGQDTESYQGAIPVNEIPPPFHEPVDTTSNGWVESFIRWYMKRASLYSNRRFIIEMLVLSFLLKIVAIVPVTLLVLGNLIDPDFGNVEQRAMELGMPLMLFSALVIAPPLETVLLQWFPIWICSLFAKKNIWKIGIPSLFFASLHSVYGVGAALGVFFPGVIFAFSFIVKRKESRWKAFWVTSIIHCAHNAVVLLLFVLFS